MTSTNPAAGSDIGFQVSTMNVTFSSSVLLSSVSPSDFTIDGNDATGVTARQRRHLSFSSRRPSNGIHNVSISGIEDLQGTVLTPDNFTFETDDVPPVVVSSSIADGAVLPPGPLTEVMTFNEPIQPSRSSTRTSCSTANPRHRVHAVVDQLRSDRHDPDDHLREPAHRRLPVHARGRPRQLLEPGGRAAARTAS